MKDPLGRVLLDWRLKKVMPHVRGRLLDIGCGTNELVRRHGDGIGVDVYGWDNVDLVVEDTAKLPFEPESFDTVSCLAALNHIPNRDEVLEEAHRVLKQDGQLILTMIPPRISKVWHILREPWDADQHERGMVEGEVYGLTKAQVRTLLEDAGFRLSAQESFQLGINTLYLANKA